MRISDWSSDVCSSDLTAAQVQEVAVVQGLQAQVIELLIALGLQGGGQLGQVVLSQFFVEQAAFNTRLDTDGEVFAVAGMHFGLGGFFAQDFLADGMQQQTGRYLNRTSVVEGKRLSVS